MKTKIFCMLFLCCCIVACEKNEPGSGSGSGSSSVSGITGRASVNSSSGRTSCEWVQLWEDGPRWATFNVGATITDYGILSSGADATSLVGFAGGSSNEKFYNTANLGGLYPWNNPNLNGRKNSWSSGVEFGIADIASTLWGSKWETPTSTQLGRLADTTNYTKWSWCDGDSVQYVKGCTLCGYKVSGIGEYAQYSIFLPAAGYFVDAEGQGVYFAGGGGYFWSSNIYNTQGAYSLFLNMDDDFGPSKGQYYLGYSVRAVLVDDGATVPSVETHNPAVSIKSKSAVVSGSVTSDGGRTITACGLCYSTSHNPTLSDKVVMASSVGTGDFSCTLKGLVANTTYYVRAYATNRLGTSYGTEIVVTTLASSSLLISGSASVLSSSGRTSCEWVQLWEDGPRWATFNVGATITDYANLTIGADPTSFGNFTELAPYYNTANVGGLYAWNNPNFNGRKTTWSENVSTGISDVATSLWGSNWETPTKEQLGFLTDSTYTTWTWCDGSTTQYVNGCTLVGYKVTGKGDYAQYSIFLPAAGFFYFDNGAVNGSGYFGSYWSSTEYDSYDAYYLGFYSGFRNIYFYYREYGLSVRAVLAE